MIKTVQIRPEQAEIIIALDNEVARISRDRALAIRVALYGLVDGADVIKNIHPDGTVTLEAEDPEYSEIED